MRASARGGSDAGEGDDHFAKVAEYAERVRNLREMRMADEARAGEANADGEYTVGGKTYSDLDLAVTEHLRQMSDPGADPAA